MKWLGQISSADIETNKQLHKRLEMTPTRYEIKQARHEAGLTQQAAADLVAVSIKSWQAYEGGWRNIRPATWRLFKLLTEGAK